MPKYNPYAASAQRSSSNSFNKTLHFDKMKEAQPYQYFSTKKDGDYEIVIVPYNIATKKHPSVKEGADVGDEVYSLTMGVHRNIGPKKATVLCPSTMFGKPCPICEAAEEEKRKGGYQCDEYKNLRAKSRTIYNVVDLGDKEKGIQVFEESSPLFEDSLVKAAGAKGRRKGLDFIHFGDGLHSITFTKGTKKIGTNDCAEYDSFDFEEFNKPITLPKGQKPFAFDEYMNILSYEELTEMFLGEGDDEDEKDVEEEAPQKKEEVARKPKKDDDDDDESCPEGLKYGKDYDRDSEKCDDCPKWRECRKLSKE